ncbi:hypothetical protein B0H17DRAFT_1170000 [Mycena rosella]|uniref:Copper acquisition factor BIM1-like domain-containing protein n=1 Tax=Mycena rosella TaxID=1033263 RepID=A0AAD7D7H1_MYCRO|nr:hypothetical protein B0H17DRAFT_1170000 [Mycena rosella]
MLASQSLVIASFITLASAHFQLQFPLPRGPFVEAKEPTFCDGYDNETTNKTVFPLTGGFFSLNSEHTSWTAAVFLSTKANTTSFNDFQNVVPFFKLSGEGLFCLPLDFSKTNATGLTDGQNVTIEIVYDGGDGSLFQCADLTLSSTAKIGSNIACQNGSSSAAPSATSPGVPGSSSISNSTTSPSSALALRYPGGYFGLLSGLVGVVTICV